MTRTSRRNPLRKRSRYTIGIDAIATGHPTLGRTIVAIDTALRELNGKLDHAIGLTTAGTRSSSTVGGGVQISTTEPEHERVFDWLDCVRKHIEQLNRYSYENSSPPADFAVRVGGTSIDCPRCTKPIQIDVLAGPGISVGTAADGTAEANLQLRSVSRPHRCLNVEGRLTL